MRSHPLDFARDEGIKLGTHRRPFLQELKGFVVTSTGEIVRQLRIDRPRKRGAELVDSLGNFPQPLHVRLGILPAVCIGNDRETFSQRICQFCFARRLHESESLKRPRLWRKRWEWAQAKGRGFWWWTTTWRSVA
jgi:hypothetical protein